VLSDLDIYRAARFVIDQHGLAAEFEAAFRADRMLSKGDLDGSDVWRRIYYAVRQLQRTGPAEGEPVN
jgi:hypothetical protein